jgi:HEAT repeat protein
MAFERAGIVLRNTVGVFAMVVSMAAASHANPAKPLTNAGPVLEEFGKQAQDQSLSEAERIQVINLLGLWATDDVRAPLMALLDDPLPSVRAAAARGLGWKGNHAAAAALKARLTAPGEPIPVRVAALEALGRIGDVSTRDVVLAATSDPDPAVRGAAFFGLAFENLTNPDDRVPLLRRMAADQAIDRAMRSQSIQALGALRDTGSAELLLRLLESEPSVAMPQPPPVPNERDNMAARYRQARDVRAWVARSLWMIQAKSAVPLLLKTAEDPHDYFLRLVSLEALANWKVEEALPVLLRRLDDSFDQNRITALWGLGNIGDRRAVDPVLAKATDRVPEVRAQAVTALGMLGDPRVRPQLETLQQSEPDGRVQEALTQALARLPR